MQIRAAELDEERGGAGFYLVGHDPLGVAEVRAAPHPDAAVVPRLPLDPAQRLDPVRALVQEWNGPAAGSIVSARALDDHRVAALGPQPADGGRERRVGRRLVEGDAHEDRGDARGALR